MRISIVLFLSVTVLQVVSAQHVAAEFIFKEAPFAACHASTIIDCEGVLVAAWFGGTREKHQDVGIWLSRKIDGGWSSPREIVNGIQHKDKRYPTWNPVLQEGPDQSLMLYFKVGPSPREWWGEVMRSDDQGLTWDRPYRLPEDILGPVKNKGILLDDGTLFCPSSTEHDGWKVQVELTKDWGRTWERIGPIEADDDIQAIQPTVLRHGRRLQMLCRSKKSGVVETWSSDGGKTWSPLAKTDLPNPNSGIDAVTTKNGMHYLVYNPTSTPEGKWGGERHPLLLAKSQDGQHWEEVAVLESEPGEYSYPAIVEGHNGDLHITYTWKRDRVKHVMVDL